MSGTTSGLAVGVALAVVAGAILSTYGGAGIVILVPFAALLLGSVGALAGYLIDQWRQR